MFNSNTRGNGTVIGLVVIVFLSAGVLMGSVQVMDELQENKVENEQAQSLEDSQNHTNVEASNNVTNSNNISGNADVTLMGDDSTTSLMDIDRAFELSNTDAHNTESINEKQTQMETISNMNTARIDLQKDDLDWAIVVNFEDGESSFERNNSTQTNTE